MLVIRLPTGIIGPGPHFLQIESTSNNTLEGFGYAHSPWNSLIEQNAFQKFLRNHWGSGEFDKNCSGSC